MTFRYRPAVVRLVPGLVTGLLAVFLTACASPLPVVTDHGLTDGAVTGGGLTGGVTDHVDTTPSAVTTRPGTRQVRERLVEMTLPSAALATTATVRVSLPVGWREGDRQRWPVVYLLHGCCDGDRGFAAWSEAVDLAAIDGFRDVLVVMPDGGRFGFYSDWLDGPKWETFHLRELPPVLGEWFGATDRRVVAGFSMGGLGALSYAGRHPGMFRAAASFSGVAHPLLAGDGPAVMAELAGDQGVSLDRLWGDPVAHRSEWAGHDPYDLAERLAGIPVYLSAGDGTPGPLDPAGAVDDVLERRLHRQNTALAQRLREVGATRAVINLYGPGTHTRAYWSRELRAATPMLRTALG